MAFCLLKHFHQNIQKAVVASTSFVSKAAVKEASIESMNIESNLFTDDEKSDLVCFKSGLRNKFRPSICKINKNFGSSDGCLRCGKGDILEK